MKDRFIILSRELNPRSLTLRSVLGAIGNVEIVTNAPNGGGPWINDNLARPYQQIGGGEPAINEMSRAIAHLETSLQEDEWVWLVSDKVAGQSIVFEMLAESAGDHDFAATKVATRESDPGWPWWPKGNGPWPALVKSFNPLCRLSPRFARAVIAYCRANGTGFFHEIMFASLAKEKGFSIVDLQDDDETFDLFGRFRWNPEVRRVGGIVHPVSAADKHAQHCGFAVSA